MQKIIKVKDLISQCVQLAAKSCELINKVQSTQENIEITYKGKNDPFTEADIQSQELIIHGLKKYWPDIKIIAEEDQSIKSVSDNNYSKMVEDLMDLDKYSQILQIQGYDEQIDLNDVIVWIDPLDGTKSFIEREFDSVTCMIGISQKGRAYAGIIAQPFQISDSGKGYVFNPDIYFNIPNQSRVSKLQNMQGPIKDYQLSEVQKKEETYDHSNNLVIVGCTSKHHMSEDRLNKLKSLQHTSIIRKGGSGKKFVDLISGKIDFFGYIGSGMKRWDTCAGEALIDAVSGQSLNLKLEKYDYHGNEINNPYGLYATINPKIYNLHKDHIPYLLD